MRFRLRATSIRVCRNFNCFYTYNIDEDFTRDSVISDGKYMISETWQYVGKSPFLPLPIEYKIALREFKKIIRKEKLMSL